MITTPLDHPICRHPRHVCVSFLQRATSITHLNQILALSFANGLHNDDVFLTKLVGSYRVIGRMDVASALFFRIPERNSFLWTAMIRGYSENGPHDQAVTLFADMRRHMVSPNHLTFPFVLKGCSKISAVREGKQIHTNVFKFGFSSDLYVGNALIDFYGKIASVEVARQIFDEMPVRDLVANTAMITVYCMHHCVESARLIFDEVAEANDVVLWSAMIGGYAQNEAPGKALALFDKMRFRGVKPNYITMMNLICACAEAHDVGKGREMHEFMIVNGMEINPKVSTCLIDLYIKCCLLADAIQVFERIPHKDVVSWNALICGLSKSGHSRKALEFFGEMQNSMVLPNVITLTSAISSCAQLGALSKGIEIHEMAKKLELEFNLMVVTALIDMYAKCGCVEKMTHIFYAMPERDVILWSALVNGYAIVGRPEEAITMFTKMVEEGLKPNAITFVAILNACSHAGLTHEGQEYFLSMQRDYQIEPRMEHYACMVDLFGRCGLLQRARDVIAGMPMEPAASVWGSLLHACVIHKNVQIGEWAMQHLVRLEPNNDGNYVILSNIYAVAGLWDVAERIRASLKGKGARKNPGCSWIEMEGFIHVFLSADKSHSQSLHVYAMLDDLAYQLRIETCSYENVPQYLIIE